MEDAPVPQETSRRRKAGALRREVAAVRRMVRDAAKLSGWRADYRGFGKFSGFAAAEGHPLGDEERNAGGGNHFRCAEGRRLLFESSKLLPEKNRAELHQERAMAGAEFSSIVPTRNAPRIFSHGIPTDHRRARLGRSDAGARWARGVRENQRAASC